jgi:hypothetical protein
VSTSIRDQNAAYFAAAFSLTAAERERLAASPFSATPETWTFFAAAVCRYLLISYRTGEIDFTQLMERARDCSLGCAVGVRLAVLGHTAACALQVKPKVRNARRPPYPENLKYSALNLVDMLRAGSPELPMGPGGARETVLQLARQWLTSLQLFGKRPAPAERTLYKWLLERAKQQGQQVARGRPRKK